MATDSEPDTRRKRSGGEIGERIYVLLGTIDDLIIRVSDGLADLHEIRDSAADVLNEITTRGQPPEALEAPGDFVPALAAEMERRTQRLRIKSRDPVDRFSQKEACEELGVAQPTLSQWLSGRMLPRPEHFPAIAAFLGVTLDQVLRMIYESSVLRTQDP
jgi:hypothetical protein